MAATIIPTASLPFNVILTEKKTDVDVRPQKLGEPEAIAPKGDSAEKAIVVVNSGSGITSPRSPRDVGSASSDTPPSRSNSKSSASVRKAAAALPPLSETLLPAEPPNDVDLEPIKLDDASSTSAALGSANVSQTVSSAPAVISQTLIEKPDALKLTPVEETVATKPLGYIQLLQTPELLWFLIGISLYAGCFFAILLHLVTFATEGPPGGPGLEPLAASSLVSYQGIANTIGRLIIGRFSDSIAPGKQRVVMQQALLLSAGIAAAGVAIAPSSAGYITAYSVIFGSCAGSITATSPAIVADLVPRSALALGIGLQSSFQAFPILLTAPVIGWMRQLTGSYQSGWATLAALMCLGALLMAPDTTSVRLPRLLRRVAARLSTFGN